MEDCARCEATNPSLASLHVSVSEKTKNIISKAEELVDEINALTPNRTANAQLQMIHILEPIFQSKFQSSLKKATSAHYNLSEKMSGLQTFQEKVSETKKKPVKQFQN